jgi:membrane protein DedA with SNARE-associated domain
VASGAVHRGGDLGYGGVVSEEPGGEREAAVDVAPENVPPQDAAAEDSGKPEEKSPWDDPRLPWSGKPRKVDIACWAAIVGSGLFLLALLPFRAELVGTHPVWGEALNGATESIVAAAAFARIGSGNLFVVVIAAFVGIMKFDIIWWWAGHLWGEKVISIVAGNRKSATRLLARVHRWGWRFSWPLMIVSEFVFIPTSIIYLVVGTAGMGVVSFLVLDFIASGLWVALLVCLGWVWGKGAVNVAEAISHYGLWVTLGIVALVLVLQFGPRRRSAKRA